MTADDITRFWSLVDKSNPCWRWCGSFDRHGNGIFRPHFNGRMQKPVLALRLAYVLTHAPIPYDARVFHTCLNTGCLTDAHLYLAPPRHQPSTKFCAPIPPAT